jgi:hypothetical protein
MPRSNRPRGRNGGAGGGADDEDLDLSRALIAFKHTESKRDGVWNVQPLSASNATKTYTCPGCGLEISPGVAHTVTWRADGLMGEANDLAGRRHWHAHCWKIRL